MRVCNEGATRVTKGKGTGAIMACHRGTLEEWTKRCWFGWFVHLVRKEAAVHQAHGVSQLERPFITARQGHQVLRRAASRSDKQQHQL